ncbi:cell surface glycoprotein 1-like isoform X2 [Myxocyprinus asiaticus]|uniref:cell surface glycoprotein 1-like isoform X2 n=1 Tax=Myxocyprinus asiaticus TaxID=70543 RepID=UPI002223AF2F|nr:cell surface glycoprotein 1-like isoform X2 [Myxocyprinus asiaticus]
MENNPEPNPDCDPCNVGGGEAEQQPEQGQEGVKEGQTDWATNQVEWAEEKTEERGAEKTGGLQPLPGIIFINEFGQEILEVTEGHEQDLHHGHDGEEGSIWGLSSQVELDGSGSEYETAEEWGDVPGQNRGRVSVDDEIESAENENPGVAPEQGKPMAQECFADCGTAGSVPKEITPTDSGFGGDAFATNWDQPVEMPVNPEEAAACVSELEQKSSDKPLLDPADPAQSLDDTQSGENTSQDVLEPTQSSDPFGTEGNDPFGTGNDPFATTGSDPFGTGNDPFANSEKDPFGESEADSFKPSEEDSTGFSGSDPFATTGSDLFFTQGITTESQKSGFDSDPFAETHEGGTGGWAADPFASEFTSDPFTSGSNYDPFADGNTSDLFAIESSRDRFTKKNNQGWAGTWESTGSKELGGEGKDSNVFDDKNGHPNGFAQWAAFPAPSADSSGENSSKGSWQEVSDSSGFFSSDGQGNFTAGWPSEAGQPQDHSASFPGQNNTSVPKGTIAEDQVCHKEPENSDLSEDEVANRRYGKLYQEISTELEEVSSKTFNGFSKDATVPTFATEFDKMLPTEDMEKEQPNQEAPESSPVLEAEESPAEATLATAEDKESPIEETPTVDAKPEEEASSTEAKPGDPDNIEPKPGDEPDHVEPKPRDEPDNVEPKPSDEPDNVESIPGDVPDNVEPQPGDETSKEGASKNGKEEEKMPIPSVVIEPASSNEGDDDRDCDIISPSATSDNGMIPECQTTKESSGMPPRFLFKVETMHDFDAANPDELELKKGDIVLVVPTELSEDQDAGWLTGIKESEWLLLGASAQKGLFPENFTQRLD